MITKLSKTWRWFYFCALHEPNVSKEKAVEYAVRLIKRGYRKKNVIEKLWNHGFDSEEIYEIARCRLRIRDKFSKKKLYFDTYGLRYSTPEIIGLYRARRIKGYTIADVSCGVGMQAIFLARTNREVLCVDIDGRRIEYAKRNARAYGVNNMRFLVGDCFSQEVQSIAKDYDIIYSDPARKEEEKERKLENLMPPPLKIIEKYGERNYVFDLPPQISQCKIPEGWEKEYISLNGRIRRLTAYIGELYQHDRRAIALPSGAEIHSDERLEFTKKIEFSDYIYIVDESIYYAQLLGSLERRYPIWYLQVGKRRTLASSSNLLKSGFLKPFKVVFFSDDIHEIIKFLRLENYGKVTLRLSVDPDKYWELRTEIERNLNGNDRASLFKIGESYVVGIQCNIT